MAARVSSISRLRKGFWKVRISRLFGYRFVILPLRDLYTSSRLYFYFLFLFLCWKWNECTTEDGLEGFLLLLSCHEHGFSKELERESEWCFLFRERNPRVSGWVLYFYCGKEVDIISENGTAHPVFRIQHRSSRTIELNAFNTKSPIAVHSRTRSNQ